MAQEQALKAAEYIKEQARLAAEEATSHAVAQAQAEAATAVATGVSAGVSTTVARAGPPTGGGPPAPPAALPPLEPLKFLKPILEAIPWIDDFTCWELVGTPSPITPLIQPSPEVLPPPPLPPCVWWCPNAVSWQSRVSQH